MGEAGPESKAPWLSAQPVSCSLLVASVATYRNTHVVGKIVDSFMDARPDVSHSSDEARSVVTVCSLYIYNIPIPIYLYPLQKLGTDLHVFRTKGSLLRAFRTLYLLSKATQWDPIWLAMSL